MDSSLNLLEIVASAGPVVKLVMLVLVAFSIASWAIIIIKYRYLKKATRQSAEFIDYFWKSRDLSSAFNKAKQLTGSPVARVFRIGYNELKKVSSDEGRSVKSENRHAVVNVERALRRAINSETTNMSSLVSFLATAGNTAPFIGLFGTVWGIMSSFSEIGRMGSANLAVVAPGISEALVATAIGLVVAIPAVIAYNSFVSRINTLEAELHGFAADLLNIIDRDIL